MSIRTMSQQKLSAQIYNKTKALRPGTASVSFTGTTGDLISTVTTPANFGSADFTAECWVRFSTNSAGYQPILACTGTSDYKGWILIIENNNTLYSYMTTNGTSWTHNIATSYVPTINVWTHLALVRTGSTITLYVNGVSRGTTSISTNAINEPSTAFYAGYYPHFPGGARSLNGYISNLRLVKSSVYTSGFTVPTNPLTAITDTSLLTCRDPNVIVDRSANAYAVTVGGSATASSTNPFT